jgi:hypothetical protein
VTIKQIKEWNNIKDVSMDVYLGMRMMVALSSSGGIKFRQELFLKKKEEYRERIKKERLNRLRNSFKLENDLLKQASGNAVSNIRDTVMKETNDKNEKEEKERKKKEARDLRNADRLKAGLEPDAFSDMDESDKEEIDPFADDNDGNDSSSSSSDEEEEEEEAEDDVVVDDTARSEVSSQQSTARSSGSGGSGSSSSGSDSD